MGFGRVGDRCEAVVYNRRSGSIRRGSIVYVNVSERWADWAPSGQDREKTEDQVTG